MREAALRTGRERAGGPGATVADASAATAAAAARPVSGRGSRLAGVDGMRAFAALWVVLFHIATFSGGRFPAVPGLDLFMRSGSTGVSLFLVLSGFCLYVPFAGGRQARFKARAFFARRCRRLMPAFYVSLVFALGLVLIVGPRLEGIRLSWQELSWQVVSHVLFIYTLFPDTFYGLNGAYWSLGLEWQLYLGLPLLIWGIRRYGLVKTAAAAIAFNAVYRVALALVVSHGAIAADGGWATTVLPNALPGRWAEFVYGMIAAELYATGRVGAVAAKAKYALVPLALVALLAYNLPVSHMLFGLLFFSLLCLVLAADNLVSRAFSWPPLVAVGAMSYSLYLVHEPLVQGAGTYLRQQAHVSANTTFFLLLLVGVPVLLVLAWLLYVTVERRTIGTPPATGARFFNALLAPQGWAWPWRAGDPPAPYSVALGEASAAGEAGGGRK